MVEKKLMSCSAFANRLDNIRINIMQYYVVARKGENTKGLEYDELKRVIQDLLAEHRTIEEIGKEWEQKVEDIGYYDYIKGVENGQT